MTAPHIVDPAGLLSEALSEASPDLMRSLLQTMINALLSADADAVVGAEYGQPSASRTAQRNGYRHRDLDTRVGTVESSALIVVSRSRIRSGLAWDSCSFRNWAGSILGTAVIKVSFFESVVRDHSKDPPGGRAYVEGTRSLRSVVHHSAGLHCSSMRMLLGA